MGKKIQFFSKSESHKDDDGRFIDAVLNESYRTVTGIIEEYEKNIKKMVLAKFKNSSLNYMDVFQEGFIILIENINAGKFKGESSVMTYLNVICFRNCLFHLKKSSKVVYTDSDRDLDSTEDFNFIKQFEDCSKYKRLLSLIGKLKKECQDLLNLAFSLNNSSNDENSNDAQISYKDLGKQLNIKTETAKKRIYRCKDKLQEIVYKDPEMREYYNISHE
jgi:RNA polymerase sigma factor (sigma-70 family)